MKLIFKFKYIPLLMIVSAFIVGCEKEDDSVYIEEYETVYLGQFNLTDSTLLKLPYDSAQTVMFTDSLNNEYEGLTSTYGSYGFVTSLTGHKTISNSPFYISYQYENRTTSITIQSLNKSFSIETKVEVESSDYENIQLADITSIYQSQPVIFSNPPKPPAKTSILTNKRSHLTRIPNLTLPIPEITISGKQFKDVYVNTENENTTFYFNFKKGIVAFTDKVSGVTYTLK